jgi:hypothetical protein
MLRKNLSRLEVVVEETAAVEAQATKTRQALKIPEEVKMTAVVVQPVLVQAAQAKQAHRPNRLNKLLQILLPPPILNLLLLDWAYSSSSTTSTTYNTSTNLHTWQAMPSSNSSSNSNTLHTWQDMSTMQEWRPFPILLAQELQVNQSRTHPMCSP